jgi:hypothetical protein
VKLSCKVGRRLRKEVTYKLLDSERGSCHKLSGRGGSPIQNSFGSAFEGGGYGNEQRLLGLVGMSAVYNII